MKAGSNRTEILQMQSHSDIMRPISWMRSAGLASFAIYSPFLLAAIYALLFVSSSHCKINAWKLLPFAPGLLPVEAVRRWFELSRSEDATTFGLSLSFTVLAVAVLAALIPARRRLRHLVLALTFAANSASAICLISMLQS